MVSGWREWRGAFRTFRLDRIAALTLTGDRFAADKATGPTAFLAADACTADPERKPPPRRAAAYSSRPALGPQPAEARRPFFCMIIMKVSNWYSAVWEYRNQSLRKA